MQTHSGPLAHILDALEFASTVLGLPGGSVSIDSNVVAMLDNGDGDEDYHRVGEPGRAITLQDVIDAFRRANEQCVEEQFDMTYEGLDYPSLRNSATVYWSDS